MSLGKSINALLQGQWLRTFGFVLLISFYFLPKAYAWELPMFCKQNGGTTECLKNYFYVDLFSCSVVNNQIATDVTAEGCAAKAVNLATAFWHAAPSGCNNAGDGYPEPCTFFRSNSADSQTYQMFITGDFYRRVGVNILFSHTGSYCAQVYDQYERLYGGICATINIHAPVACPSGYDYFDLFDRTPANSALALTRSFNENDLPVTCIRNIPIRPKNPPIPPKGCDSSQPATLHPINIGLGNKFLIEPDAKITGFDLSRSYTSSGALGTTNIGTNWRYSFERKLMLDTPTWITVARPNGSYLYFKLINNAWQPDADIADTLSQLTISPTNTTAWTYFDASSNATENYDVNGNLTSIVSQTGRVTNFTFNTIGGVQTITNDVGQQLTFSYDASTGKVSKVQLANGGLITYTYSANNTNTLSNLVSVTYPDSKTKTYHYGGETAEAANVSATPNAGVSYANALTGIIDENGNRYATYRYDAAGRAYDEELAPDLGVTAGQAIEHNNLVYNVDGSGNPTSTVVTDGFGSSRTYNFTTILGVVKSTGQSQPAGSGCAASAAALTYDANGNVASRTDFKGNQTTYVYDMARNLEISRTEGLTSAGAATAATRTITTTWHATWRLLLVTAEYAGATATGAALHSTTNVYDAKGNITSITEADPLHSLSRTTTVTYTYSTLVPGLVLTKVIDGPRTDVSDISTYHYYEADSTCTPSAATPLIDPITNTSPANLGCRGQLQSMTDALGHTMTYDRYNHHGQVEQMTDANGLVTTNTYDLRQRLLTRSVTGAGVVTQTTSLTYDGVGQVTQLTLPDASQLNYTYDAAHRLTQLQDNLGNKVTYTLDSEGNRINEVTTDPQNVLTKTLTRSYDALNRLQQVIGVQ